MQSSIDVISIGALSRNPFWGEKAATRASHATTTLIRDKGMTILVDPSLPAEVLVHRLEERSGLRPDQIDAVFLTSYTPTHRRGLQAFEEATWLMHEDEIAAMAEHLNKALQETTGDYEADPEEIEQELVLLGRFEKAPDKITERVHLFPSPGVTPGCSALLATLPRTWVIAGDAILSRDHHQNAQIYDRSLDAERARQSFAEIVEIAEVIVPGHDNQILVY